VESEPTATLTVNGKTEKGGGTRPKIQNKRGLKTGRMGGGGEKKNKKKNFSGGGVWGKLQKKKKNKKNFCGHGKGVGV